MQQQLKLELKPQSSTAEPSTFEVLLRGRGIPDPVYLVQHLTDLQVGISDAFSSCLKLISGGWVMTVVTMS